MTGRTIFLVDWQARDGTVVGSTIRDGSTMAASYVCADVRFDQDYDRRMIAWLRNFEAGAWPVSDLRTVTAATETPAHAPAEIVTLHDGPELQHLVHGVEPVSHAARLIAQERQRRAARRGDSPLPSGGLFDAAAHAQQDMFA